MEEDLKKKIQARFAELPEDLQKAIQSSDLSKKVQTIAQKYQLHIDQSGSLEDEILMAMLGFTDPGEFEQNIVEHARVPKEKAGELAADVGKGVFAPIRTAMQEFSQERALRSTLKDEGMSKAPVANATPAPKPRVQTPPQQVKSAEPHPADMMLSQKVVQTTPTAPIQKTAASAPAAPAAQAPTTAANPPQQPAAPNDSNKPQNYKADPYREPVT